MIPPALKTCSNDALVPCIQSGRCSYELYTTKVGCCMPPPMAGPARYICEMVGCTVGSTCGLAF